MKIKLDENIPATVIDELSELGHDTLSVYQQGLKGTPDSVLWEKVQAEQRFFITQDLDFSDSMKFRPGSHAGILLLRLRDPGRLKLRQKIKELFANKSPEDNWFGAFIVISDHKIGGSDPTPAQISMLEGSNPIHIRPSLTACTNRVRR